MSLTKRQAELLMFIHKSTQSSGGVSPSYVEMAAALGVKSSSGIHRLIWALVERGYVRQMKGHARAVEVLRLPYGVLVQGAGP